MMFIYTFADQRGASTGGHLRLFDEVEHDGSTQAGATSTEFAPEDNSIVFFPADCHYDVTRTQGRRFSITGMVLGGSEESTDSVVSSLPYEVRPTPGPVQHLLEALLHLRAGELRPDEPPAADHAGTDPGHLDIEPFGPELARWLQPVAEAFAGASLQADGVDGLQIYLPSSRQSAPSGPGREGVSAMLTVAAELAAPWPLALASGAASERILLAPGQMLLLNAGRCHVWHPEPVQGRSVVLCVVHYRRRDER